MPKTHRKKINGKAPFTRNSRLVLVQKGTEILRKGGRPREITKIVYTGSPAGKVYPYGSSRQGYGAAPRVQHRSRPVLAVDSAGTIHEPR